MRSIAVAFFTGLDVSNLWLSPFSKDTSGMAKGERCCLPLARVTQVLGLISGPRSAGGGSAKQHAILFVLTVRL